MLSSSHYDDEAKADRAVKFIEMLRHTKGKWAGKRFWLLPWQEQIVRDLFGIVKPDGKRQFRTAYIEIGKEEWKKSELAAAVALCISCMQTTSRLLKSTVQRLTVSRLRSFLTLPTRW
jgi:phage terminase large subunit-like protein